MLTITRRTLCAYFLQPLLIDMYKSPVYDLLAEVNRRSYAPIGLPFLTAFFRYLSRGMQTSENNMHLMIARYRKAMSANWDDRPGGRGTEEGITILTENDIQAMEDFALQVGLSMCINIFFENLHLQLLEQTASYFIVLVVAAMLGAVGANILTATSRRLRLAAVSQLPIVEYTSEMCSINNELSYYHKNMSLMELLSQIASTPLMDKIHELGDIVSGKNTTSFLHHLKVQAPDLLSDLNVS